MYSKIKWFLSFISILKLNLYNSLRKCYKKQKNVKKMLQNGKKCLKLKLVI